MHSHDCVMNIMKKFLDAPGNVWEFKLTSSNCGKYGLLEQTEK